MKNYIEILLFIILIVCFYNGECQLLADMMNNHLGKVFMLALVVLILSCCGKTAGVLAALIYIFILHQHRVEGFEEGVDEEEDNDMLEGASFSLKIGDDDEKKKEKESFTEGASLKIDIGGKDDEDEEKEGFISFSLGGDKDGFWAKKNSKEGYIENMKHQITKLQRKVKKLEKRSKKKKEGFANLRQNRRLKLNHISVLNTTDLDRIIKKDSEIRTLNSTA
tara:strand:+ start:9941 stop:10606 length:666 start_codon:yes stop_codon:yes gene_type:complete